MAWEFSVNVIPAFRFNIFLQKMKNKLSILLFLLIITLLLVYFNIDYFASIIPGWNTTINSTWKIIFIFFVVIFIFSLIIAILITLFFKLLKLIIKSQ
jgi:hypothetical protein